MVGFGASVLKGISENKHTTHFVLYDHYRRVHLLHSIISRLPTDVQRQFIIDRYTDEYGYTFPCIGRSASGESTDNILLLFTPALLLFTPAYCVSNSNYRIQHLSWYASLHLA